MRLAFWSKFGRGACVVMAAGLAFAASGCSSGVSRFDFPSFNLSNNSSSGTADLDTTASLPVPSESVYSPGRYHYYGDPQASGGQVTRSSLPPPKATQASYSPMQKPKARGYAGQPAPRPEPAIAASGPRIKVQSGDTLSSLSRRYGVPIDRIQSANNLADARLRVGQELIMPGASAPIAKATPDPAPTPAADSTALAAGETAYIVAAGDTPNSIAQKLGADEQAILARNGVRPDSLQIGQKLVIPASAAAPSLAAAETTPSGVRKVKTTTIPAPGSAPAPETTPGTVAASPEVIGGNAQKLASVEQLPSPDPMSGASFRWPVKGRVISGFGTKPDGGHNDGINISVPQGTPVKAAENGVVAYAGSELKGYGNLVLVRHANNWVSAYANNEAILVKRGDKVTRGQVIANAGTSGSVSQPQVHFELRKGSRPVDPTKYMSSMTAEAD